MTPQEAADILRNSPGFSNILNDPESQVNNFRNMRSGEITDALAAARGTGDVREAARQATYQGELTNDENEDPSSTLNVQKRDQSDIQARQKADQYMDPSQMAMRGQQAAEGQANAFGMAEAAGAGKTAAEWSPDAQLVDDHASQRKIAEAVAPTNALFGGGGDGSAAFGGAPNAIASIAQARQGNPNYPVSAKLLPAVEAYEGTHGGALTPKLSARADQTLQSLRQLSPLIGQLSGMLDPSDNSLGSRVGNSVKYGLYHLGISPDIVPGSNQEDQLRMQLAGLIKVLGSSPYAASSRNFQFLKQAQEHLTDPAATPAFLASQLHEMQDILPMFQQEILQNESNPSAPLNFSMPGQSGGGAPNDPLGIRR